MTSLYAPPRDVTDLNECYFYHTIDLPRYGTVQGEWDLRGHVDEYIGDVDLRGKRVLEMGTAGGFLCFEMEKRGAEVVALDVDENCMWDYVPFARYQPRFEDYVAEGRRFFRRLNNAWWLAHKALGSKARVVYRSAYQVPEEIGPVDVATFGMFLLHLHNPFLALANALRLTRQTAVVTATLQCAPWDSLVLGRYTSQWVLAGRHGRKVYDHLPAGLREPTSVTKPPGPDAPARGGDEGGGVVVKARAKRRLGRRLAGRLSRLMSRTAPATRKIDPIHTLPCMVFIPHHEQPNFTCSWWFITPVAIQQMLGVLGFEESSVTYHVQKVRDTQAPVYTVVAQRTQPMPTRFDLGRAPG